MTPAPAAFRVIDEVSRRLVDPSDYLDEFTLRRYRRDLEAAFRTAPVEMLGPIHAALGRIFFQLNETAHALVEFTEAARLQPGVASHPHNVALVHLSRHQYGEALPHLRLAQSLLVNEDSAMRAAFACTEAKVHRSLGNHPAAREAFERAVMVADARDDVTQLRLALNAADLDYENDAAELLARHIVLLPDHAREVAEPAAEALQRYPDDVARLLEMWPTLATAVRAVLGRWDGPIPGEHEIRPDIALSPDAWSKLQQLAQLDAR